MAFLLRVFFFICSYKYIKRFSVFLKYHHSPLSEVAPRNDGRQSRHGRPHFALSVLFSNVHICLF